MSVAELGKKFLANDSAEIVWNLNKMELLRVLVMGVIIVGAAAGLFMWRRGKKKARQFANMMYDSSEYKAQQKKTFDANYVGEGGPAAFIGPRMGSNCDAYIEKTKCNSNPPCQWNGKNCETGADPQ